MKLLSIVLLVYLWSCLSYSQEDTEPITTVQVFKTFKGVEVKNTRVEITNMPRIRSQDSLGICKGFSTAAVVQEKICKIRKITDCSKVSRDKEISPLGMIAWANPTNPNSDRFDYSNHMNIKLVSNGDASTNTNDDSKDNKAPGSNGAVALENSQYQFSFMPESCYPFDQFANKHSNDPKFENELISKLNEIYKKNKITTEAAATAPCAVCIATELNSILQTKTSAENIKYALRENTFEEFLYTVIFGSCEQIFINPKPKFKYFPKNVAESGTENVIPKVIEVLKSSNPVLIESICFQKSKVTGECKDSHSFVISGYKKVCSAQNQCRDMFKIHNSWGEDWQKAYDDGWVDAQSIVDNIYKAPPVANGVLSWLE